MTTDFEDAINKYCYKHDCYTCPMHPRNNLYLCWTGRYKSHPERQDEAADILVAAGYLKLVDITESDITAVFE